MSDLIDRQAAIDALEREKTFCTAYKEGYPPIYPFEKYNMGLADGIKALKALPSARSEIIRCKDCKWKQGSECVRFADVRPFPNDFCSRAERKGEEE